MKRDYWLIVLKKGYIKTAYLSIYLYIVNAEHYNTFLLTMSRLYAFMSGKAAPAYTCVLSVFEGH